LRESEVIAAIKKGSKEITRKFYLDNQTGFTRFIRHRYTITDEEIEDLYQDAIIALIENIRKGKLDELGSSLSTYLFSIGKFMAYRRTRNILSVTEEIPDLPDGLDYYEHDDTEEDTAVIRLIQHKLEQMSEACKRVLFLFYYEQKSLDEIAEIGGYAGKDVVKSQKSRCLAHLKKLVHGKF